MTDWISVEDRMPGDYEDVLLLVNRNGRPANGYPTIEVGHYYGKVRGDRVWADKHGEHYFREDTEHERVTHWMPLPEPPDEDPKIAAGRSLVEAGKAIKGELRR